MTIEKVSYAGNPERVTEESFDCLWVRFTHRKHPSPLVSQVLQWVDWKMQGQLSRFVLMGKAVRSHTTFVPTRKRLGTPLLALIRRGDLDWKSFTDNCEGLGVKQVLILCEDAEEFSHVEKELRRRSSSNIERVVLGTDGAVGRG